MSPERVLQVFVASLPFLRPFNPYARHLANFRDHALLIYGKPGVKLRPEARPFPRIRFGRTAPAAGQFGFGAPFTVEAMPDNGRAEVLDDCKSGIMTLGATSGPADKWSGLSRSRSPSSSPMIPSSAAATLLPAISEKRFQRRHQPRGS